MRSRPGRIRPALLIAPALLSLLAITPDTPDASDLSRLRPPGDTLPEAVADTLEEWLPEQLRESGVPGAAVAVVGAEGIVWEAAYGNLDGPQSRPVDTETLFAVRSVSKSVTSLAVLMAVQEGLVDLDAPISEYLPGFTVKSRFDANPERRMTLRHLLSHRAGFTHETRLTDSDDDDFQRYIESISDTWLRFPVGYRLAYANLGTDLAAYILQVRSGVPYPRYVKEKVLDPIGMTGSSFDFDVVEREENRAIGHAPDGDALPLRFPELAAAGLYSNARDMARYVQFHLNGGVVDGERVLGEDLVDQYHSIAFARPGQRSGYGFGLVREATSRTFSLYHEGGGRGFQSLMIVYPELGYGVVLLINRDGNGLTGPRGRAVINAPIIERHGPNIVAEPDTSRMLVVKSDDPRVRSVLGRYGGEDGWVVGYEDEVLGVRTSPDSFYPLAVYDDRSEIVGMFGAFTEIHFLPPAGLQPRTLMIVNRRYSNDHINYQALNDSPADPPGPEKPEWRERVGEYEVLWRGEPDRTVGVTLRNGYLYYGGRKCVEHEPGLFFSNDGEAIDFRSDPPTAANLELRKKA
jgi:CubicO group peptidase (beta-lactamase class C family)